MSYVNQNLGKALTVFDVAVYIGVSQTTVRKNYKSLGGIRVGSRYVFFERKLENAILQQGSKLLDGAGSTPGEDIPQVLQDKKTGHLLGIQKKNHVNSQGYTEDKHDLIT